MTTYDVTPDDDPLDIAAVSSDDALVEQLRHALSPDAAVVWDDEDDDVDPALALLRALQVDVSAGVAADSNTILPTGVTELLPRRRHLGRGATIAVVSAAVLSVAGVAAASAPGQPLAGVRHAVSAAVSHAVSHAVDALTPDSPVGPVVEATERPSAKPMPPGDAVSAAERSASAVRQIEANLDRAAALIDDGRYQPAKNQLNAAASKLLYVTDAGVKAGLQSRLTALQSRLAAMPTAKPTPGTSDDKGNHGQDATKGGNGGNNGSGNGGNNGNGGKATHSPKAVPTHKPRVEPTKTPGGHGSDDATPDESATPDASSTPEPSDN
jgi:hypothetical protein